MGVAKKNEYYDFFIKEEKAKKEKKTKDKDSNEATDKMITLVKCFMPFIEFEAREFMSAVSRLMDQGKIFPGDLGKCDIELNGKFLEISIELDLVDESRIKLNVSTRNEKSKVEIIGKNAKFSLAKAYTWLDLEKRFKEELKNRMKILAG